MLKKIKSINYRHWISLALVLGSAALCLFVYRYPVIRLWESVAAFGRAFAYAFLNAYGWAEQLPIAQTVNDFSAVDLAQTINFDIHELADKLTRVWDEIPVGINLRYYGLFLLWHTTRALYNACIILLISIVLLIPIMLTWDDVNNDYNQDTRPLALFKRLIAAPCRHVYEWCRDFLDFFRYSRYYGWFVFIWLLNFGVFAVVFSFLAYYFWVLAAFDLSTIGVQLIKLAADVLLMLHTLPWYAWAVIFLLLFDKWRIARASNQMQHMEACNKGLLGEMPMCSFVTAPPRTGKTTMITSMALSLTAMFRHKALELMTGNMHKFPRFPWINFELDLKDAIRAHYVYNLYSARAWVRTWWTNFLEDPSPGRLWDYDINLYPITYNDALTVTPLGKVLENYAQEFFIYFLQTSILVSAYSIREDFLIYDQGNFPIVDTNFFARDPATIDEESSYAHVIDYDMLRLGKKMLEQNPNVGGLEFGIVLIPEVDKERKNDLRLRELKLKDDTCTQKNDLFNEWMKMAGQSAMVENFCFLRILSDAQRPSSWGADARELSIVLHIDKKDDSANALPLFWAEEGLINKYLSWWEGVYVNSRFKWGNNRLLTWLGEGLASVLYGYLLRRTNSYGYWRQIIQSESGTLEKENLKEYRYTIARKKDYAERFASDHFKSYSQIQTAKCNVGLNDLPAYNSIYPTFDEMIIQNSHFCHELIQYFDIESVTKEKGTK